MIPAVPKFLEDGANGDVVVELNIGTLGLKSNKLLARCPPALSVYSVVSRSILAIGTIGISDLNLSASYDATVYTSPVSFAGTSYLLNIANNLNVGL